MGITKQEKDYILTNAYRERNVNNGNLTLYNISITASMFLRLTGHN